jgi:hypothetical protein
MTIEHACFISFPRGTGKDSLFAKYFYEEFCQHLASIDKTLSVFKYDVDRCEARRQGDDWTLWIQRELCSSAMMMAVCAPNYFNGSPACVSEFRGMELLIQERTKVLGMPKRDWLLGLRLKDTIPMPALNPYDVSDFLDCGVSPEKVRRMHRYRQVVSGLADRVYAHWSWLQDAGRVAQLHAAGICGGFKLPPETAATPAAFPFAGGVR